MKNSLKRVLTLSMAAAAALAMTTTAFADEPYNSYNYDTWEDPIPSQSGYRVERTVTGAEMGLSRLSDPEDPLFVSENASPTLSDAKDMYMDDERSEFWVADSKNNRILRLNKDLEVIGRYYGVKGSSEINVDETTGLSNFMNPYGVYVMTSPITGDLTMYVADYDNSRVVKAKIVSETECELIQEYTKPEEALYSPKTFNPTKILVDNAENVYAVVKSVNTGSVQFARDGSFTGFYGANRVEVTAAVIAQKLWRTIASNDQIAGMARNVPVEYANFDIDADGFIYTVTEVSTSTDAVKKLNPAGYNIWDNDVGNKYNFGDIAEAQWDATTNSKHSTRLTDIVIGNNGLINVLDYETGRVFQYDRNCNLVCIFGTKNSTSDQRGSFGNPNAVEALGNNVYVLDGAKNDITVFTETMFGKYVHAAFENYDEGRYSEAKADWEEVIKRDGNYTMAYIGLGKAALNDGEYSKALKYFKTAYDQDDYDKAFKYTREDFLRDHFTAMIVIILAFIVWVIILKVIHKKGIYLIKKKSKEGK